jgi:hypothetical protein
MLLMTRDTLTNIWAGMDVECQSQYQTEWVYLDQVLVARNELGQTIIYGNDPATIPPGRLTKLGVLHLHSDLEPGLYEWATLCEDGHVRLGDKVVSLTTLLT